MAKDEITSKNVIDFVSLIDEQKKKRDACKHIYGVDEEA